METQQHQQLSLTIKSTSGRFTERFNAQNRAQKVLDEAIRYFGLATGGSVSYTLRREAGGGDLALGEKLADLGVRDGDVLVLQTNQAQDG
ncbi:EsaB/YukD family protein [Jatrophihabitans sp.]|uniref:EsaB/YukD family protein n=1 Tax=Jatrophihabitans sp. TaxID=1932789 RepID=UPI002EFD3008